MKKTLNKKAKNMNNIKELEKECMKDPQFVEEYEKHRLNFEIAIELTQAREKAKITQKELAKKMKTTQCVVSRMESGNNASTLQSIKKYAEALGKKLKIKIV